MLQLAPAAAVWQLLLLLFALIDCSWGYDETIGLHEIPVTSHHHNWDLKAFAARHAHGHGSMGHFIAL